MKNSNRDHICIGIIINTHGIRGEVKVEPLTFDLHRFSQLNQVLLGEDGFQVSLEASRSDNRFVYLKFKEYNNINDVIKFKNQKIYISEKERLELPKDHFYEDDLLGKEVLDENSNLLGKVMEIIDNPANWILVIKDSNNNTAYVPFVKSFVKSIEDVIIIEPIEGMFS